ncbi:MAG: hypothetical protein HQM12_21175 [SAR324 cluster bacterium]|nr:hypothetical protein [SAR324 cluster bacterium]
MSTAIRMVKMLQLIPSYPRKISTRDLECQLLNRGFKVSLRTIQRDLNSLPGHFPLVCDEQNPQGWFWSEELCPLERSLLSHQEG